MNPYTTDDLTPPDTDEHGQDSFPLDPPPPGTIRHIDIHVYDQPAEEEEDAGVESSLDASTAAAQPSDQGERDTQQIMPLRLRWDKKLVPAISAAVSFVLIATILIVVVILPLFAPYATITIIPVSKAISTTTTITITNGTANAPGQLAGRALPAITMSQVRVIQTTGIAHQEVQAAHGLVAFYNAAPYAQTVAVGTVLTGADGTQIVTDQDALIPAGNLATNGQTSVSAHAIIPGPSGNIQAGDVYGQCCRMDVLASNAAFSGGEPAKDYHTVTKQDITNAVSSLSVNLQQSVQTALQTQVQPSETLIMPLPCTQSVTSEHATGSEATMDRITVNETCTGTTYLTQGYQRITTAILAHQASLKLGQGYMLTGSSQSMITQVTSKHGKLTLHVHLTGTYANQFSQEQQEQIKARIAGKSKALATAPRCSWRSERFYNYQEWEHTSPRYHPYPDNRCFNAVNVSLEVSKCSAVFFWLM